MRILLLNQFFYPDSAATSQLLTDLARRLAAEGHSVRVICGRSSYAEPDPRTPPAVQIVRRNPAARIAVVEKGNEIFAGWIFTRFPDVHPFQHPRFSLTLEGGVPRKKA